MNVCKYGKAFLGLVTGCLLAIGLASVLDWTLRSGYAHPGMLFASTTGTGSECTQSSPCSLMTALGKAGGGDALYVGQGTYTGTGTPAFEISEGIILNGGWDGGASGSPVRDPAAYPTILDGEGQRQVVLISGSSPTLDGFTIVNGNSTEAAGIAISGGGAPIIRNCVITNNVAYAGWGGGIQVEDGSRPLIEHNRIMSNATAYQGGGVAASFDSHPMLRNNLIVENSAQQRGGGIRLRDAWATLVNNTVANNTGVGGDGIYATNATITLTNNIIIVSNTYGLGTDGTLTATITYNDVWGNGVNYSGLADPTGSNGNISLNPLFVSGSDGSYYLSQVGAGQAANSPCVDSGSDSAADPAIRTRTTRTDGETDSGTVDMGYHYGYGDVTRIYLPLVLKG